MPELQKKIASVWPPEGAKPIVVLIGQDGNAYAIMTACRKAARKAGWTASQVERLLDEMMDGSYTHLLNTAEDYFEVH